MIKISIVCLIASLISFQLFANQIRVVDLDVVEFNGERQVLHGVILVHEKMTTNEAEAIAGYIYAQKIASSKLIFSELMVFDEKGNNLALKWIQDGFAIWDATDINNEEFQVAQNEAVKNRRGIWKNDDRFFVHHDFFSKWCDQHNISVPSITEGANIAEFYPRNSERSLIIVLVLFIISSISVTSFIWNLRFKRKKAESSPLLVEEK